MNNELIFDSHIHLPMKSEKILFDLEDQTQSLFGYQLILNSKEELLFFMNNVSFFTDRHSEKIVVLSLLLDENIISPQVIRFLQERNFIFSFKLHPRLLKITKHDFGKYIALLHKYSSKIIIVDGFYYGANHEYHINIELAIALAKSFPERTIIIAHAGGHKALECSLYTRSLPNVYFDISFSLVYLKNTSVKLDLLNLIRYNVPRILFGSDYPDFSVADSYTTFNDYSKTVGLSADEHQAILYRNAVSLFK